MFRDWRRQIRLSMSEKPTAFICHIQNKTHYHKKPKLTHTHTHLRCYPSHTVWIIAETRSIWFGILVYIVIIFHEKNQNHCLANAWRCVYHWQINSSEVPVANVEAFLRKTIVNSTGYTEIRHFLKLSYFARSDNQIFWTTNFWIFFLNFSSFLLSYLWFWLTFMHCSHIKVVYIFIF